MRAIFLILALLIGGLTGPGTALADCVRAAKDLCATENGHYRVRVPKGLGPHPTVLYLYGSTGQSAEIIGNRGFAQAFLSRGYAVIVPAALDLRYATGPDSGWLLRHERGSKRRDDIAFIAEVLRDAETHFVIDPNNVLIAGMSRGGFLTWEIACHRPGLGRAYAPVAAGYLGPMPGRCAAPVRLLHTHGRGDSIVPLDADQVWGSGGARAQPLPRALGRMAATGGCAAAGEAERYRGYDRTTWEGCQDGASIDLLEHDGGHTIPLSWFGLVIDWFEQGNRLPSGMPKGGGTAVFRGAGQNTLQGTGGRFKRAPGAQ